MSKCISKCRDPLYSMLTMLHERIIATWPDTVVTEPESMDREGWIDFAMPDRQGSQVVFSGVRFRRDKAMGMTVVLAAQPERDPDEWVHASVGQSRPLGYALGLPRPFQKEISEEEWRYLFDLLAQARSAVAGV